MKWIDPDERCVRRFALFPIKQWSYDDGCYYIYWLEYYYLLQFRNHLGEWHTHKTTDRETWMKWKANKKRVNE